jgi:subtilisin family serine protease
MRLPLKLVRWLVTLGTATVTILAAAVPAAAAPAEGTIRNAGGPTAVTDGYLVVLADGAMDGGSVPVKARDLATRVGARVGRTYTHALRGFEITADEVGARRLAADPSVAYVEQNHRIQSQNTQSPAPSWGLDRIDQRNQPLTSRYEYPNTARNVRVYLIDSGIRFSHTDFGGRAVSGFDAVDGGPADDCQGHGTQVASTAGGSTYGVAKGVTLVAVRVLDCAGTGTTAQILAGIDFVTGDHDPGELAVANMSLAGAGQSVIDNAVNNSFLDGVTYAVAAGNDNAGACNYSPARTPNAITVGATDGNDARAPFSNVGVCLDLFAPGVNIAAGAATSDTATGIASGTSMASAHVAGAAALLLTRNPSWTPRQVRDALVNGATPGVVTNPVTGSPNRLLFVENPPVNDFTVGISAGAGSAPVSGSLIRTVTTETTSGAAQTVNLSTSGLPGGASAMLSPPSVTSNGSSLLIVNVSATTPIGAYPVTITGTAPSGTRSVTFTLTVVPHPCVATNPTDIAIPDLSTVESTVISGCTQAAGTITVEVHIVHPFIGDLVVSLVAPDGRFYPLHYRVGGAADDIHQTYRVGLQDRFALGNWRLRVQDMAAADTGHVDGWTLDLTS